MFLDKVLLEFIKNWFQEFRLSRVTFNHAKGADRSVYYYIDFYHQTMGFHKVPAGYLPRNLVVEQSGAVTCWEANLALFNCNPKSFLNRCYIVNKTLVHYFDAESKCQSQPPCNFMLQLSTSMIMTTVFFNAETILMFDYRDVATLHNPHSV